MISIVKESDIALARQQVFQIANALGFEQLAVNELTLAVSEIAQNAFRHAGGGVVLIATHNNNRVIEVQVIDRGMGIENIELAMREGYSTIQSSLGVGLEAAKRLVDKFDINSRKGVGTTIKMEKYLPFTTDVLEYGVVSLPSQPYQYNSDAYLVKEYNGNSLLLAVINNENKGYDAYLISNHIKKTISEHYGQPLDLLIRVCYQSLKNDIVVNGISLSLLRIEPGTVNYLGIGDTHAYLLDKNRKIELKNAVIKTRDQTLHKLKVQAYSIQTMPISFVLCTNGVEKKILNKPLIHNNITAQQFAQNIFSQHHKLQHDATVLTTIIKQPL